MIRSAPQAECVVERAEFIECRDAVSADSLAIARHMCAAGDGIYEFLFDGLVPFVTAVELLAIGIACEDPPISYRNCHVALDTSTGALVGMANAFPADLLKETTFALVPRERMDHLGPMMALQDWGSFFLNALAVDESQRGKGIATRLLAWARIRAETLGLDRVSLHVWADNVAALSLYKAQGFVEVGSADIPHHARLRHSGRSLLMSWARGRN